MKQKEFEQLYSVYYDKVWRLCLGYCHADRFAADDLTQEVFARVWTHWDRFRGDAQRSTWLFRIAVNTSLSRKRKLKNQPNSTQVTEAIHDSAEDQHEVENQPTPTDLYACIDQLNALDKSIIMLELEGVPQKEIAAVIGKSHAVIRTRVHRIKDKLKTCLNHE
jgi:RNA polymerase sigma-70 factor (ECF subfamily)